MNAAKNAGLVAEKKTAVSGRVLRRSIRTARSFVVSIVVAGIIAVTVLYCVSGGFMKQTYMEPWSKSYAAHFSDPRVRLAALGLLAASNHNMQPWKIRLDESNPMAFSLYADSSRMTPQVDPQARQMMISQGTFLEYVAVGAVHEGYDADIRLFPEGSYDESDLSESMDAKPIATITLTAAVSDGAASDGAASSAGAASSTGAASQDSASQQGNRALYDAMFLPDTNRGAYRTTKLTESQVTALTTLAATPDGAESDASVRIYQDRSDVSAIAGYALRSATIEAGVSRVRDESNAIFRPNEYQKNKYRYGYSVEGQGTSGFVGQMMQGLVTIFPSLNAGKAASKNFIDSTRTSVDHTAAYAVLATNANSRMDQVESGMLYSKLVLTAHALGLAMQPLSQVLEEYPEMRTPYDAFKQSYAPAGGVVQMLFRVGAATSDVPLSMRRDVRSVIMAPDV